MLQRIGDSLKASKKLKYLLLAPLALVFALWGAAGIVNLDFFGAQSWAAKADGEKIEVTEIQNAWRDRQSEWQQRVGAEMPEALKAQAQDDLLEQFIRSTLVSKRTNELGYRVGGRRLSDYIHKLPAFQIDGKYDQSVAKSVLAQRGLSETKFETDVTTDLRNQELQRGVEFSEFYTSAEINRILALENEQRQVRVASLPAERFAAAAVPPAAIEAWYKEHGADYVQPEAVKLQYAELRLEQVAAGVAVAEQDLTDYYNKNKDRYVEPEKRRARHILISIEKGDDTAALRQAQAILGQARGSADFSALAQKYSQDAGTAKQGGDLGWSERSAYVGPFGDALFGMALNEIRGPVRSEFGYHIIRLDGIQPGKTKTLAEAHVEIDAEVRKNKAADEFGSRYELVQRELEKPGVELNSVAKLTGMTVGEVAAFERGAGGAPLGADAALQEIVFGDAVLNQKKLGGPVNLGQDRFVIVKALEHRKATPKPLTEVRDAVIAAVRKDHAANAARIAAEAAVRRLQSGESIEAVAASIGAKLEPARFASRADPALPARLRAAVFEGLRPEPGKPRFFAVALEQGGAAFVAVTASKIEVDGANAQAIRQRANEHQQSAGAAAAAAYVQELRRVSDVAKNPKAFE